MRSRFQFNPTTLSSVCLAIAGLVVFLVVKATTPDESAARQPLPIEIARGTRFLGGILDEDDPIEDGGLAEALRFMPPIHDPASLEELRAAVGARGRLGLAVLKAEFDRIRLPFRAPREQVTEAAQLLHRIGLLSLYQGRDADAGVCFQRALTLGRPIDIPPDDRARGTALLGILALRRGEPTPGSSAGESRNDLDPIERRPGPARRPGAREAIIRFTSYLAEWPEDLRVRWLLNLAYMERGEYPEHVPPEVLVPLDWYHPEVHGSPLENVARDAGLTVHGRNLAGGSVFDDFDGDGRPDLFTTSLGVERGASLFVNRGDGTFRDASAEAGLADQIHARNAAAADFDNDGDLDVLLVRGGGELPFRLSLLRNRGRGAFEDVTISAGLAEPIASGAATWGDYDSDGRVDLFVCGEYRTRGGDSASSRPDPRNRCRLYRNRGNGTFVDVAPRAGVANERCAEGAAWGDYDDDGRLDLYVSNRDGPGRLYRNLGDGTFRDVAPDLGVTGPRHGSSTWFWDYDNDGRLDLFVTDGGASLTRFVAATLGRPAHEAGQPRLYHNLGAAGFRDDTREVGLDRCLPALGANFGDIDNDGYPDVFVGTGWRSCSGLLQGRMFKNIEGRRFQDVTTFTGTGVLRKASSVSFADWDADGDLDLFLECGGVVPGDASDNVLYRNPAEGRHWLAIRLVGTRTNRSALGAHIRVDLTSADGGKRSIHRTVGNNSSTGGNSLTQSIGLLDAARVDVLTVRWPTSRTTSTFRDLAADQVLEITEGAESYRVLRRGPSNGPDRGANPADGRHR